MNKTQVTIGAQNINRQTVVQEARQSVERKQRNGTYSSAGLNTANKASPLDFKTDSQFLSFYLETLRENVFVDISDFEIEEKRHRFRSALIRLKKGIWNLLKFYTYRMWSQQNQINGLLLSAIEGLNERREAEIRSLKKRIAELEKEISQKDT